MARRRIFIGDLQGCREEFEQLLEVLRYDPASDALHPVGDLVNRGPDSVGCLRLARALGAEPVLGNHDVHLLRQRRDPDLRGNRRTLEALAAAEDGDALLDWLDEQPLVLAWEDVLVVRAGVRPQWGDPAAVLAGRSHLDPADEVVEFAVRARHCDASGATPPGGDWPPPGHPSSRGTSTGAREGGRRTVVSATGRGVVSSPRSDAAGHRLRLRRRHDGVDRGGGSTGERAARRVWHGRVGGMARYEGSTGTTLVTTTRSSTSTPTSRPASSRTRTRLIRAHPSARALRCGSSSPRAARAG